MQVLQAHRCGGPANSALTLQPLKFVRTHRTQIASLRFICSNVFSDVPEYHRLQGAAAAAQNSTGFDTHVGTIG